MKIARIKEIKNIGAFADFPYGASLGFDKVTIIYGFNTYGKTTLADIFQSLKENNPQIIQERKTIPQQSGQQRVILSAKNQTEKEIKFISNSWSINNISNHLEIFSTDFIHNNLFSGLTIERNNRENFTHFILGEQGVKIAEEIAEKKKKLGDMGRDLNTKKPNFVKYKGDAEIKRFLEFSIQGLEKDKIDGTLSKRKIDLQNENSRLKEPQKILELQEPNKFEIPIFPIIGLLNSINTLLQEDYSNIKDDVLKKMMQHLTCNYSFQDDAENWIKKGLNYCKDKKNGYCPFCGQSLHNVQDLINIYNSYFDPAYNTFIERIENGLEKYIKGIESIIFSQKTVLQIASTKANYFRGLIEDKNFQIKLDELQANIESLQEENLNDKKNEILETIKLSCDKKNKFPYKKFDTIDFKSFETALVVYSQKLAIIKGMINELLKDIQSFKKQYENIETIQKGIDSLIKEIEELEYKKARIDQDKDCNDYQEQKGIINDLELAIPKLQSELQTTQSQYLKKYFTQINSLFKKLGSKNFTLEKATDSTGHFPVYSLKVKFHGVEIPNNQLKNVFSESDKRALALTIFWAKINLKEKTEKIKTVIILDDPMTSFDDNRVTNFINIFKESINQVSQMIILTHYLPFIKRYCEITKDACITTKYLKIDQNNRTSFLSAVDAKKFMMSDYENVFLKIYGFINKSHSECIKQELRPFLENLYLPTVFIKQIKDKEVDCSSLENMIDGIFDDEKIKAKLHEFRKTLNPDSHLFTSNNDEDVRGFASDMMEYLCSLNFIEKENCG